MKKYLLALTSAMLLFCSTMVSADVPVSLMKSTYAVPTDQIINIVKQNIKLSSEDYFQANVQVVMGKNNKIDYLLVYLLSAKNYSFTITKIQLDENYQVISVTPNYQLQKKDLKNQASNEAPVCPDESIEFVAATPVPAIKTAKESTDEIYQAALAHGYKAKELLGNDATVVAYKNWLVCPNLKGFFNVGHGSKSEIYLSDGVLTHEDFSKILTKKLREKVVVEFNSCEVMNDPLKSAVIKDADSQKYAGGITNLGIGVSEPVSECFWDGALSGKSLTDSLTTCSVTDKRDKFGIDGLGEDKFQNPGL